MRMTLTHRLYLIVALAVITSAQLWSQVITLPKTGTIWSLGQQNAPITWTTEGVVANVEITLWRFTSVVATIVASTPNDGSHTWNVPTNLVEATNYYVKVKFLDGSHGAQQGEYFAISAPAFTRPTVSTSSATNIQYNGANLNGSINPNGATTSWYFEYGTTTGYGSTANGIGTLTGSTSQSVYTYVSNLQSQTLYHFRLVATNAAGTTMGSDRTFTTSTPYPSMTTGSASPITTTAATLNGTVDPNGISTNAYFQYGTTTSYTSSTGLQSVGYGTNPVNVNQSISNLLPGTLYHFRIAGSYGGGIQYGSDATFTTVAGSASISGVLSWGTDPFAKIGGLAVVASDGTNSYTSSISDYTTGAYTISNVPAGTYTLSIQGASAGEYTITPLSSVVLNGTNLTGQNLTLVGNALPVVRVSGLQTSFTPGQPFTFRAYVKNSSSSISMATASVFLDVSFPDDPAVTIGSKSTEWGTTGVNLYSPTQPIPYNTINTKTGSILAQFHKLVSATKQAIPANTEYYVDITVTPPANATYSNLRIRYRGTIADRVTPTSGTIDQQGWYSSELSIPVAVPPLTMTVVPNRFDQIGGNHVTISREAFLLGLNDRFATYSPGQYLISCLKAFREGLWVQVSIKNNSSATQTGTLQEGLKYPGSNAIEISDPSGSPLPLLPASEWQITLNPGETKTVNVPIFPNYHITLPPYSYVVDGSYDVFFRYVDDFPTLPQMVVQIKSDPIVQPAGASFGNTIKYDYSQFETPPSTIDMVNDAVRFVFLIVQSAVNHSVPDPNWKQQAMPPALGQTVSDRNKLIRGEFANAAFSTVSLLETGSNYSKVRTKWKNIALTYYDEQGISRYASISFDRAKNVIDIRVAGSSPFPTITNLATGMQTWTYTDSEGFRHTTVVWCDYGVDKNLKAGDEKSSDFTINHSTNIELNYTVEFEMGPYRGAPNVDDNGGIIDYALWSQRPDDVSWVAISAYMAMLKVNGTGVQSITSSLVMNQPRTVDVGIIAPSAGNYYVRVFNDNLLPPDWNWAQTESPLVALIEGQECTFHFSVTPNTSMEGFQFWLYRQTWIPGVFYIIEKVSQTLTASATPVVCSTKVFLQGCYSSGGLAQALRTSGVLPLGHPYTIAPWSYTGTEAVLSIPAGVVDWVLLELRTGTASSTRVATRAAFIKNDGHVVDLDGTSPVSFPSVIAGNYYLVLRHRNHLAVMSAAAIPINTSSVQYDFTTASGQYFGGVAGAKDLGSGVWGMLAGNNDGDNIITVLDYNAVGSQIFQSGYRIGDHDMNGIINVLDYNPVGQNIFKSSQVP